MDDAVRIETLSVIQKTGHAPAWCAREGQSAGARARAEGWPSEQKGQRGRAPWAAKGMRAQWREGAQGRLSWFCLLFE